MIIAPTLTSVALKTSKLLDYKVVTKVRNYKRLAPSTTNPILLSLLIIYSVLTVG